MSRYSIEIREQAVALVDAGFSISEVAARFGMHPDTLDSWLRLRERSGSLAPRLLATLTEAHLAALRTLVESNPAVEQEALVDLLYAACGIHVHQTTIGNYLRKMGFKRVRAPRPRRVHPEEATGTPGGYRTAAKAPERRRYPSDLTDAEWAALAPYIPAPKPGGRPAKYDRRTIVEAILYVTRTGCQWRALPHDFPPWSTVYQLFREWRDSGVWERANTALRERTRLGAGRCATPSAAIIDSQVAKTTEKGGSADTTAASASRGESATSSWTWKAS